MCGMASAWYSHFNLINKIQITQIRNAYMALCMPNLMEIHCAHTVFENKVRFLYIRWIGNAIRKEAEMTVFGNI